MSFWSVATLVLVAAGVLGVAFIAGMIVGQNTTLRWVQEMLGDYGLELTHDPRRR